MTQLPTTPAAEQTWIASLIFRALAAVLAGTIAFVATRVKLPAAVLAFVQDPAWQNSILTGISMFLAGYAVGWYESAKAFIKGKLGRGP